MKYKKTILIALFFLRWLQIVLFRVTIYMIIYLSYLITMKKFWAIVMAIIMGFMNTSPAIASEMNPFPTALTWLLNNAVWEDFIPIEKPKPTDQKEIELLATVTSANQTVTINPYFKNEFMVSWWDQEWELYELVNTKISHSYHTAGEYHIKLVIKNSEKWSFKNTTEALFPKKWTTVSSLDIITFPDMFHFSKSENNIWNDFFGYFNYQGAITSLPEKSFDLSDIITVWNHFFSSFNQWGNLTTLPEWSFKLNSITSVGNGFFDQFNAEGALQSLPEDSFQFPNIATVENDFFSSFNREGQIKTLPNKSFDLLSLTNVGDNFFASFNAKGNLQTLPNNSFNTYAIEKVGDKFFSSFNAYGSLTTLPGFSFKTNKIKQGGSDFFSYFNAQWNLLTLPVESFNIDGMEKVGSNFFGYFNAEGNLTNLPRESFNTAKISSVADGFFMAFNKGGNLTELPEGSFNINNLTSVGNYFFASFNEKGSLGNLPKKSFNTAKLKTVWSNFFASFNEDGKMIALPQDAFDLSKIKKIEKNFLRNFNYNGNLMNVGSLKFPKLNTLNINKEGVFENAFNAPYDLDKDATSIINGNVLKTSRNVFSHNQTSACSLNAEWKTFDFVCEKVEDDFDDGIDVEDKIDTTVENTIDNTIDNTIESEQIITEKEEKSDIQESWDPENLTHSQSVVRSFDVLVNQLGSVRGFDTLEQGKILQQKLLKSITQNSKDIILKIVVKDKGQYLTINKYFDNEYTVNWWDLSPQEKMKDQLVHTYEQGIYYITLSLTKDTRWKFKEQMIGLVPSDATNIDDIEVFFLPDIAQTFGKSAHDVGSDFFSSFNLKGAITKLPENSFDLKEIQKVDDNFFKGFNYQGSLASLPENSFDTSQIIIVGSDFFAEFNKEGDLETVPENSFNLEQIIQKDKAFLEDFNEWGKLWKIPEYSGEISRIEMIDLETVQDMKEQQREEVLPQWEFDFTSTERLWETVFKERNVQWSDDDFSIQKWISEQNGTKWK